MKVANSPLVTLISDGIPINIIPQKIQYPNQRITQDNEKIVPSLITSGKKTILQIRIIEKAIKGTYLSIVDSEIE